MPAGVSLLQQSSEAWLASECNKVSRIIVRIKQCWWGRYALCERCRDPCYQPEILETSPRRSQRPEWKTKEFINQCFTMCSYLRPHPFNCDIFPKFTDQPILDLDFRNYGKFTLNLHKKCPLGSRQKVIFISSRFLKFHEYPKAEIFLRFSESSEQLTIT